MSFALTNVWLQIQHAPTSLGLIQMSHMPLLSNNVTVSLPRTDRIAFIRFSSYWFCISLIINSVVSRKPAFRHKQIIYIKLVKMYLLESRFFRDKSFDILTLYPQNNTFCHFNRHTFGNLRLWYCDCRLSGTTLCND